MVMMPGRKRDTWGGRSGVPGAVPQEWLDGGAGSRHLVGTGIRRLRKRSGAREKDGGVADLDESKQAGREQAGGERAGGERAGGERAGGERAERTAASWFLTGMQGIVSLPGVILLISFVGFTAFAQQSGVPVDQAVFMTGIVWALPAKLILVGSIQSGASLPAAFVAVTLSSIRLMPMVAALIPEIRTPRTRTLVLLFVSHLVAVTAWVMAMERVQHVPRQHRVTYVLGLGVTLVIANMILVGVLYSYVAEFPPLVAGCLFFLTPVYFLASIWSSGRHPVIHIALVVGLILGPLCTLIWPEFDLLLSGLVGGTLAWGIDVMRRRRREAA
jgi:predicted branched-subunit amino acid permease